MAEVPGAVVQQLLDWRCTEGVDVLEPPLPRFRTGQRIRVTDGPLAGLVGVFAARCGEQRVRVLLEVLGQATPVELHPAVLRAS